MKDKKTFSKSEAEKLKLFLNGESTFPVVAHNAKYDRDEVLKPAFEKVGVPMISDERWKCTWEMAPDHPDVGQYMSRSLDFLLPHLGLEGRNARKRHDAMTDCRLTAMLYMKLCEKIKPEGLVDEESAKTDIAEDL